MESGGELGARDGCYISTSSSLMVEIKWMHAGSLTPSSSANQSWQQHVLCMVVFGGITKKRTCHVQLSWGVNHPLVLCHLPLQWVLLAQQMSLSGSGKADRGDQSVSVTPSQRASKTVTKPCVGWEGCGVCAWMWQEMLSEQSWMLLKMGVSCVIQFEGQQSEGFCSASLGALSDKSCGKQ